MISRIDHVSLAVRDYARARDFFTRILGAVPGSFAEDGAMGYRWHIFSLGDLSRFELITPSGGTSFLDGFLRKREGGVHHVALQTPDIYQARQTLEENGIPYFGFNDYGPVWKELFIHPRDAFGVLIQIAEFQADDWIAPELRMPSGKKFSVQRQGTGARVTLAHPGGGTATVELSGPEVERLIEELGGTR